jgi:hypothetical protein
MKLEGKAGDLILAAAVRLSMCGVNNVSLFVSKSLPNMAIVPLASWPKTSSVESLLKAMPRMTCPLVSYAVGLVRRPPSESTSKVVVLASRGLAIGRDDHAFIVLEQDLGAGSNCLVSLGDGDGFPVVHQLSSHVNLDRLNYARGLRQDPSEFALLVDDHMTRPAVDFERALEGHLAVLEMVE